jgi:hypothetical protein
MPEPTRRQHYVPEFYLSQWANPKGQIACHDVSNGKTFVCNPANALVQSFLYEEDPDEPDNRVEKILSAMESVSAPVFKKIAAVVATGASDNNAGKLAAGLQRALTAEDLDNLSQFAAYQYMRVPGAIEQKTRELQPSEVPERDRAHALNPGRFVESGYAHVKDRFRAMKIQIFISPSREFITCDWPCFDMKDSENSPLLGGEIGKNPEVLCYVPLAPKVGAVFYPAGFSAASARALRLVVVPQTDGVVKNQNTLVIQKAERFVVASREEPFIFKIAAKRKKGRSTK